MSTLKEASLLKVLADFGFFKDSLPVPRFLHFKATFWAEEGLGISINEIIQIYNLLATNLAFSTEIAFRLGLDIFGVPSSLAMRRRMHAKTNASPPQRAERYCHLGTRKCALIDRHGSSSRHQRWSVIENGTYAWLDL